MFASSNTSFEKHFSSIPVLSNPIGKLVHEITIGQSFKRLSAPIHEAINAAKEISARANALGLPVQLCLSGGIDSEAMAEAFLRANVAFEVYIWRYNTDWNIFDYQTAIEFCNRKNIIPSFVDLDVFSFLDSEDLFSFGSKYACRSPQMAVHLKMLDLMNLTAPGVPVLAGNPIFPIFKNLRDDLASNSQKLEVLNTIGIPGQTHATYLRYFEKNKRIGFPFFFLHSPELIFSFFKTDAFINRISGGHTCYGYLAKCETYRDGGFSVIPRKDKYTGFERYREVFDRRFPSLASCAFNKMYRTPLEQMNPLIEHKLNLRLPDEVVKLLKLMHEKPLTRGPAIFSKSSDRRNFIYQVSKVAAAAGLLTFVPQPSSAYICVASAMGYPGCAAGDRGGGTPDWGKDDLGDCVLSCCQTLSPTPTCNNTTHP